MKTKDVIEGLTILEKYRKRTGGFNIGAEHDQLFAYATDMPLSTDDLSRMVELGWFQHEVEYEDKFTAEHYNPKEDWSCYA